MKKMMHKLIVIGASFGGVDAIALLLSKCKKPFLPIAIVQHLPPYGENYLIEHFHSMTSLTVKEAQSGDEIKANTVYITPPNYHLLIEVDYALSLSLDDKVHYSRPSIDVLFESAADVYGSSLIGVLLTGANEDGSAGLAAIKAVGGMTIVQDPNTALASMMPAAAIKKVAVDHILALPEIASLLCKLGHT